MKSTVEYNGNRDVLLSAPVPKQTKTYKPVTHDELMTLTLESIHQAGFKLEHERYSWVGDGQIATGRYIISNVADSEMQLQIAWQNSYNKQVSLKFAIGVQVMVCQNGCVSGDMGAFKRKHQGDVQEFTPSAITEYIKRSGDTFIKMQDQREKMKQVDLTSRQKAELVGRLMLDEKIISSTELNIINKEISKPSFDYGSQDSLWELYQHTTYALKQEHPAMWMSNLSNAHEFFVNAYGEIVDARGELTWAHEITESGQLIFDI